MTTKKEGMNWFSRHGIGIRDVKKHYSASAQEKSIENNNLTPVGLTNNATDIEQQD